MFAALLASFFLFLREGLEATLIVSIMLAALRQLNRPKEIRAVWIGIGAALGASLLVGIILYSTIRSGYLNSVGQTIFETFAYLLAVVILTGMTFWVQSHSSTVKKEITAKASAAGSGFAIGLLAFSTVGREALETMVFTLAFAFQANGWILLIGGTIGVLAATGLSMMIYQFGYRLDFRIFFRVMGIMLLLFAAGLLGDAIQNLQQLGWVAIGTNSLWNTGQFLSEGSTIGDMLHTFLGYAEAPTLLQVTCYVLFLAIAGTIFTRMTRKPQTSAAPQKPVTA